MIGRAMQSWMHGGNPRNPLSLGIRKRPTLKHRPAIWECMLGTVYARNPGGLVKYFDYDWEAAIKFAEIGPEADPRTYKMTRDLRRQGYPPVGRVVLWVRR